MTLLCVSKLRHALCVEMKEQLTTQEILVLDYGRPEMGLELMIILYFHLKHTNNTKNLVKIQTYNSKEPTDKLSRCLQSTTEITFSEELCASRAKHFRNQANYLDT